uniref:CD209 antigen-like protein B n=1 Tax=Mastacembelus armatus TaxID=205130 RepID=A0A7N8XLC2_9TELE
MISNDDYSTDGKSFHPVTGSKVCLPFKYPVIWIGNNVLAVLSLSITGGSVSNESSTQQMIPQTLIIEVKHLQRMQSEAIKSEEMAKQALETEVIIHQQLKLQLYCVHILSAFWKHAVSSCGIFETWSDSRADCIGRGADLAVIDNLEEQVGAVSLFENLPKLDRSVRPWWSRPVGVWIGITDIQTEGTWVWVNNVTLQDGGYWIQGEPNNHGAQGEDCGALINIDTPMRTWFDGNCQDAREWLCEMQPN